MLELYHWEPNTFSLKPLIALHEKGLEFRSRYVDFLNFEQVDLPFAAINIEVKHNPEGEGPILVHNGAVMTESFFINLYLDEAFPERPLRAEDAASRWRVLMWGRFANEVLAPAIGTLGCHKYLAPLLAKHDRRAAEQAIARMATIEQREAWTAALNDAYTAELLEDSRRKIGVAVQKIEGALADADWLVGASYSLADIDVFALLHTVSNLVPGALDTAPRTAAWLVRIRGRSAVKAAFGASKTGKPEQSFTPGAEHSRWG